MIAQGLHAWSSHELTETKAAKISSQTEKVLLLTSRLQVGFRMLYAKKLLQGALGASKIRMTQQIRTLAANPDDWNLIPRTHRVEGET